MNTLYAQVKEIVELQDSLNKNVNPDWVNARYPFLRATYIETVEAIEHYGWKFWKKQEPDIKQTIMEVVDVAHFLISEIIVREHQNLRWDEPKDLAFENAIQSIMDDVRYNSHTFETEPVVEQLESIARNAINGGLPFTEMLCLLPSLGIDWDYLAKMYVGKNSLNQLRQAYGYKTGEYVKVWNGREDNEHLYDIIETLDLTSGSAFEKIYSALERRYLSL